MEAEFERLLAEKMETIITRGIANTRLRDFYDVYILQNDVYSINKEHFRHAIAATCKNRGSEVVFRESALIIQEINVDENMQNLWMAYQKKFDYAQDITWDMVISSVEDLLYIIKD